LREQALSVAAKAEWQKALKAAEGHTERLSVLLRMVAGWNWSAEVEEILWTFVNRFPEEKWAFHALNEALNAAGKTRSLLALYSKAAETDPTNYAVKNNLAMTALLLNAPERKPHELARQVYEHDPKNPFYVSTYAFSLYLQDKTAEALQLFDQLKPEQLENPMISAYYGIILQATGNDGKARKYLDLAVQAKLLPEEADLVRKAKARI
jgi:predicted Zn-dependent protease